MNSSKAVELHEHIPPRYYLHGIKRNPLQKFWHLRRFKNISDLVEPVEGEILDIGCADGVFTKVIMDRVRPRKTIGIDIVESLIKDTAGRFSNNKKARFLVADANDLPFENNRFDAVFCLEALEHVSDPRRVLKEIKRVLKPRGYTIILVPTDSFLFKVSWWVVLHTWGKYWQGAHVQSFNSKNRLPPFVQRAGLVVEKDKKFLLGMLEAVKARKI